jgi:hypothetical protein
METVHGVVDYLNANQPVLLALASLLAVVTHYALDHFAGFGKLTNRLLGLVAIPGLVTALLALATSIHAYQYPVVVVLGQLLFAANEKYKSSLVSKDTAQVGVVSAPIAPF